MISDCSFNRHSSENLIAIAERRESEIKDGLKRVARTGEGRGGGHEIGRA